MNEELQIIESWAKTQYPALSSVQEAIVNALHLGNTREASFGHVGISRTTFYRWLDEDGTFRDAVTRAEHSAEIAYVGVLAKASWREGDWRAAESWLKRRRRATYGDNISIGADKEAERLLAALFAGNAGEDPAEVAGGAREEAAETSINTL